MAVQYEFGAGFMTGTRNDQSGTFTPRRFGTLQDVMIEYAGEIKELFGQYQFPVDVARGKTKINGKAKFAQIKGAEYNDLFFGQTQTAGQLTYALNESFSMSGTSYTVANSGSTPLTDQGVFLVVDGTQFDAVNPTATPSSNQYSFNATSGVYTFAAANASQSVYVNYLYKVATGQQITIANQPMGNTPQFGGVFFQRFENHTIVMVLNKCVSTSLRYPTRIDDFVIQEMDFSAFADAGGNVGSINVAD